MEQMILHGYFVYKEDFSEGNVFRISIKNFYKMFEKWEEFNREEKIILLILYEVYPYWLTEQEISYLFPMYTDLSDEELIDYRNKLLQMKGELKDE